MHLRSYCSRHQCRRCDEASGRRDIYLQWLDEAHEEVISDPGGGVFVTDPKKPAGGHVLVHAATVRLMFRKGKGEQRICRVFDAPNLPEAEAISFYLSFCTFKIIYSLNKICL
ncbi:hypothetical protein JHK87_056565 [Glycine soja]|nr:hypothetical protein JHK87_056565 [Glycine soja]